MYRPIYLIYLDRSSSSAASVDPAIPWLAFSGDVVRPSFVIPPFSSWFALRRPGIEGMAGIAGIAGIETVGMDGIAGIDGMDAFPSQPVTFDDTPEKTPLLVGLKDKERKRKKHNQVNYVLFEENVVIAL